MNINLMIENIDRFFFKEESEKNTVTLEKVNFSCFSSLIHSEQAGVYDYKSFKAIYDISNRHCDMPDIENIQDPKVIDDYSIQIDSRKVHMIQDHYNHVVLIGYNDKEQTEKSKIKMMSSVSKKFEINNEYNLLNDGFYEFIFIPERLMFNGIKTIQDIDSFLNVISLYMLHIKSNIFNSKVTTSSLKFNEIYELILQRYISICVHFLYRNLKTLEFNKTVLLRYSIIESCSIFCNDLAGVVDNKLFREYLDKIEEIYDKANEEEFLDMIIYGSLEVS